MRFAGRLHTWNEERGFGFIRPLDGGQDIFVHGSTLPRPVPAPNEILTFEVALNRDGKKKAVQVRLQRVEQAGLAEDRGRSARESRPASSRRDSPRQGRWPMTLVAAVVVLSIAGYAYQHAPSAPTTARDAISDPASPRALPRASSRFQCDGRTLCSQMTSCEEATYFLGHCPGVQMDGNHDGIPCERQWCH